jgi:hypothetical protein
MDDPVKGGFYMAADYVKYSMPIATSMTALVLSLVRLHGTVEHVQDVSSAQAPHASRCRCQSEAVVAPYIAHDESCNTSKVLYVSQPYPAYLACVLAGPLPFNQATTLGAARAQLLQQSYCTCSNVCRLPTLHVCSQARFPQGFNKATTLGAARAQLRYGADYLLAAHTAPDRFVVQVGAAVVMHALMGFVCGPQGGLARFDLNEKATKLSMRGLASMCKPQTYSLYISFRYPHIAVQVGNPTDCLTSLFGSNGSWARLCAGKATMTKFWAVFPSSSVAALRRWATQQTT